MKVVQPRAVDPHPPTRQPCWDASTLALRYINSKGRLISPVYTLQAHLQSDSRYQPTFDKRPPANNSICSTVNPHSRLPTSPFCYLGFPLNTLDRPSLWFWLWQQPHTRVFFPLRPHIDLDTHHNNLTIARKTFPLGSPARHFDIESIPNLIVICS
jgi:hypothetical protein